MSLEIIPVQTDAHLKAFIELPYDLYAGQTAWRAPLRFERKAHISANKNPAIKNFEIQHFLARRNAKFVGRITAFINDHHLARFKDKAGHFGFFDCQPDPAIGIALLGAAENWLRDHSMEKMIGPSSWSVNDECGLLVDGFEYPPVMMMPYGRPEYPRMMHEAGLTKAVDMLAFQADLHAGYPRPRQTTMMVKVADRDPEITVRPANMSKFVDEVRLVMNIFNDAWSDNWGFIPFSDDQIVHMAKDIKPLIFKEGFWVGELSGEPIAFIWMVPDLYSAIYDLGGKLLPFGWAKFLWRLKVKGVKQARIPLMGLRKSYHNTKTGLAIVAKLSETVFEAGRNKGFTHCELSWILEDNQSMIRICEQASAKPYKTYRMYEKVL